MGARAVVSVSFGCPDWHDCRCRAKSEYVQKGGARGQQVTWDSSTPLSLENVEAKAANGDSVASHALEALARIKLENKAQATWAMLHRMATQEGKDQYVDPATGYAVFTATFLKKRPCCGNRCRHCPHGHANVPKQPSVDLNDW